MQGESPRDPSPVPKKPLEPERLGLQEFPLRKPEARDLPPPLWTGLEEGRNPKFQPPHPSRKRRGAACPERETFVLPEERKVRPGEPRRVRGSPPPRVDASSA
eukprot:4941846-Pyramimonas_sp.AAC.1